MRTKRVERRFGLFLDGHLLTATTLDDGRVVSAEAIVGQTPGNALQSWLAKVKPRGPVTVAVMSRAEQAASVALAPGVPEALVRRHVESRIQALSAHNSEPLVVAARLTGNGEGDVAVAHVAALPTEVMDELWKPDRLNIRFTVPAMTYSREGVHLVMATSSAELLIVSSRPIGSPVLKDSLILASGGLPFEAEPAAREAHAESIADEVDRAIDSWRRRGYELDGDVIFVTGTSRSTDELFEALELRGYRAEVDLVSDRLTASDFEAVSDESTIMSTALAAAAALCEPGPLGFLAPPHSRAVAPDRRFSRSVTSLVRALLPSQEGARDDHLSRRLQRTALATLCGAVLLAALAVEVPEHVGAAAIRSATRAETRASVERAALNRDIVLATFNHSMTAAARTAAGARWNQVVPAIVATVPPGVSILTMNLVDQQPLISVTVTAEATTDTLVPKWLSTLEARGIDPSTPQLTVDQSGDATFGTTFVIPWSFR